MTTLIATISLGVLLIAEAVAPFFIEQRRDLRRLVRHDMRNVLLGAMNMAILAVVFAGLLAWVDGAASDRGFGVVRWLGLRGVAAWVVSLLLFDGWMYWWHRINHVVPLFWRFHRVHHSDPAMNASSGLRFHPGEIVLSGVARMIVVPLVGVTVEQLVIYGALTLPIVMLQHANVCLPRWLDFGLFKSGLLVTPAMHRVHHSQIRDETNSNYSSVLAIWDRLFGSLRIREDVAKIEFGLPEFTDEQSQTVVGMLATPFVPTPQESSDR